MNFIITLIILIIVLGIIVFIHELGHFIAAKKSGVYVHEFAIGMGPEIYSFKRKNDETKYSLRLLPLGGYNALANENEVNKKIKKEQILENKSFIKRFFVLIMGIVFNFILAIILFFINSLIYGSQVTDPYIGDVVEDSPAYKAGIQKNDLILKINGVKVSSFDDVLLETRFAKLKDNYKFLIERDNLEIELNIKPDIEENENNEKIPVFGFTSTTRRNYGFLNSLKYSFSQTYKLTKNIFNILGKLFTGKISASNLSGPVGVFSVIDNVKSKGLESLIYLTAYLSLNVGIINIIPIPVFDGGRLLLLLLEKIKGKKLNPKIETYLNAFGTILLIVLMIYVTFNDIFKLL